MFDFQFEYTRLRRVAADLFSRRSAAPLIRTPQTGQPLIEIQEFEIKKMNKKQCWNSNF